VWRDDELIAAGLGNKTGQGMGHIAMSGDTGAIQTLADLGIDRKIFCISTIQPGAAARFRRARNSRARRLANSR